MLIFICKKVIFFILFIFTLCVFQVTYAESNRSRITTKNTKLICDYKREMVDFFDLKEGRFVKRKELGLEELSHLNKFVGIKIFDTDNTRYIYGAFVSIHSETGKIAPNPIGSAYVKSSDMYCLNIKELFLN